MMTFIIRIHVIACEILITLDLIQRGRQRRRRIEDARMGHDGQEFVHAGPGDRPGRLSLGERSHAAIGRGVPLRIFAVRVDENIGVEGDQPPRPS